MIIQRNGEWLTAEVDQELVMISVDQGTYIGLNAVGARVWELLETPREQETLYEVLRAEFNVSQQACQADVDEFLAEMERAGAIVITE